MATTAKGGAHHMGVGGDGRGGRAGGGGEYFATGVGARSTSSRVIRRDALAQPQTQCCQGVY